jgi:Na+/H+ antiporter NhaA
MSIFIAGLAFPEGTNLETAKIAVLVGSGFAAMVAYAIGRVTLTSSSTSGGATTAAEAEGSTTS